MNLKSARRNCERTRFLICVAGAMLAMSVAACGGTSSTTTSSGGGLTAYITNAEDNGNNPGMGAVIPVDLTTNKPGAPLNVGKGAGTNDLIVASDGKTGYVTNEDTNSVNRINLATGELGKTITVGSEPVAIAFVPNTNEKWAWTSNYGGKSITTVNLATGQVGQTISVPDVGPNTVAFTPDGKMCYVANWGTNSVAGNTVTPIQVTDGGANGHVLPDITVGPNPNWIAITNDGKTAYVENKGGKSVMPIDVANNTVGEAIPMPGLPIEMQISPDGKLGYVAVAGGVDEVIPLDLTTTPAKADTAIKLPSGTQPHWIAFTPDGQTAYVVGNGNSTLTSITVATNKAASPIKVSTDPDSDILAIAIVPTPH